jgi:hypothetical protein
MCKMDKSSNRIVQYILLCGLWIMAHAVSWGAEHRSVGIYSPKVNISKSDQGEITYFIIYVIINEVGKKLDNKYSCPVYCGVNHKHNFREYEAKKEADIDEKTNPDILRSVNIADRK